jgi:uncharacterized protein YchJ
LDAYLKEKLSNYLSEFSSSDLASSYSAAVKSGAPFLLEELLMAVVEKVGALEDLSEKVMGEELIALGKRYDLSSEMTENLPAFSADFFDDLETQGRFADGSGMGRFLRTFCGRLGHQTAKRPGQKINRNDPCPCGSGLKYKKCCLVN